MNFVSPQFLYFLCIFLAFRWVVYPITRSYFTHFDGLFDNQTNTEKWDMVTFPGQNFLLFILLLGSYLFYASWSYKFLGLIILTSLYDFVIGKEIHKSSDLRKRRILLFLSVILNLSILGFYKYSSFFLQNFVSLGNAFGLSLSQSTWSILLPAGISFYTFQSISYTVDVYRKVLPAEQSFFRYALFLAFFPQLVAGPIVMAKEFLPQIANHYRQKFSEIPLNQAFYFILLGFVKKSVLADNISVISDLVFSGPEQVNVLSWVYILMGMVSYSIQIYGDFSGYTDIARGVAFLFGFQLPENFNLPYLASSLTDFWRRWHISLSSWLRSYLYISLGGNRFGDFFTYRNLLLTMILGGFWHGASWNFIIWGGLHGFYLGFERFLISKFKLNSFFSDVRPFYKNIAIILYTGFTFLLVTCFWVFFRSPNLSVVMAIFKGVANLQKGVNPSYIVELQFYVILLLVLFSHLFGYFQKDRILKFLQEPSSNWQFIIYAFLGILAVLYSGELRPFIYFVF